MLWGTHAPFFPVARAQRTAQAIPGARLTILEGCGHFLPEEAPERVAAMLTDLVERARPDLRSRIGA